MLFIIPMALSVYYSWSSDYQPQGRYILAPLSLYALACVYGYSCLVNRVSLFVKKLTVSMSGDLQDVVCRTLNVAPYIVIVMGCFIFFAEAWNSLFIPFLLGSPTINGLEQIISTFY